MERRTFITGFFAMVAAVRSAFGWSRTPDDAVTCAVPVSTTEKRHVYRIIDGGESYWYASTSEAAALIDHLQMNYVEAGVDFESQWLDDVSQVPDDELLRILDVGPNGEAVSRWASEWAYMEDGMIGCTVC